MRTHVLRSTWHVVAAEDIGWLLELTAPRIRTPILQQLRHTHGLTDAGLDRATSLVLAALTQHPDQTRDQLALDQLICSGPRLAGAHTYAAFADRVPSPRRLDRDEALAELALRYFTGHGPATERDLAYWATLTLNDMRKGLAQVRQRLACCDHDGRTLWHAQGESPPLKRTAPAGHLLQILDEIYLGYQDSRMVLDSDGIVPIGREPAIGMALIDAQMIARMKRTVGRRVVFELNPYNGTLLPPTGRRLRKRPRGMARSSASNTSCSSDDSEGGWYRSRVLITSRTVP